MIAARSGCDAWAAVDQAQRCISSHQCGRTIRGAPRPSRLTGRSRSRTAAGGAADSGTKRDESAALSVAPISFQARRLADRRCRRRCARPSHATCAIRARARIRVMQPRCRSSLGAHSLEGPEVEIRVVRVLAPLRARPARPNGRRPQGIERPNNRRFTRQPRREAAAAARKGAARRRQR
jgi:hypothetical protein